MGREQTPTTAELRLASWLQRRLEELPPNATLTVTWRRERSGHLLRTIEIREGRVLTPTDLDAQT